MQTITSEQIDGQLAALETALTDFEAEAERLSLGAVSGDKQAVDALATVHARITQASTDRAVLTAARAAAEKLENAATDAEAEAERAAAHAEAVELAGKILNAAQRADALAEDFRALVIELKDAERGMWAALRRADAAPSGGVIGQTGIAGIARNNIVTADRPIRPERTVAEVVAIAWRDLLEDGADAA